MPQDYAAMSLEALHSLRSDLRIVRDRRGVNPRHADARRQITAINDEIAGRTFDAEYCWNY